MKRTRILSWVIFYVKINYMTWATDFFFIKLMNRPPKSSCQTVHTLITFRIPRSEWKIAIGTIRVDQVSHS